MATNRTPWIVGAICVAAGLALYIVGRDRSQQPSADYPRGPSRQTSPNVASTARMPAPHGPAPTANSPQRDGTSRKVALQAVDSFGTAIIESEVSCGASFYRPQGVGQFAFDAPNDASTLTVSANGFEPVELKLLPGSGNIDFGQIPLRGRATFRCRVVDDNGVPVSGAVISVKAWCDVVADYERGARDAWQTLGDTNDDGYVEAQVSDAWTYSVEATAGNRYAVADQVRVRDDVVLLLARLPNFLLRFLDSEGRPITALPFQVERTDPGMQKLKAPGRSDADGRCDMRVPPGKYHVSIRDFAWKCDDIDLWHLVSDQPAEAWIHLKDRPCALLHVRDSVTAEPVTRVGVRVLERVPGRQMLSVSCAPEDMMASSDGTYRYPLFEPSQYRYALEIRVAANGYGEFSTLEQASPRVELTVDLVRQSELPCEVRDQNGQPLPNCQVRLRGIASLQEEDRDVAHGVTLEAGTTDASGRWASTGWRPGAVAFDVRMSSGKFVCCAVETLPVSRQTVIVTVPALGSVQLESHEAWSCVPDCLLWQPSGYVTPTCINSTSVAFDKLAAGKYKLVSRAWLPFMDYCESAGMRAGKEVVVNPGSDTKVEVKPTDVCSCTVRGSIVGIDHALVHRVVVVPKGLWAERAKQSVGMYVSAGRSGGVSSDGDFAVSGVPSGDVVVCVVTEVAGGSVMSLCENVHIDGGCASDIELTWTPAYLESGAGAAVRLNKLGWKGDPSVLWQTAVSVKGRVPVAAGRYVLIWEEGGRDEREFSRGQVVVLPERFVSGN